MPTSPVQRVPSSAIASFIDRSRIDRVLAPFVPDAAERGFVVRCILDEGPAHHRGANYALLALLGELAARLPVKAEAGEPSEAVPMRLPPHASAQGPDREFPIRLPTAVLELLAPAGSVEHRAIVDCLIDGPPQHALANVAMVCLLARLLAKREGP